MTIQLRNLIADLVEVWEEDLTLNFLWLRIINDPLDELAFRIQTTEDKVDRDALAEEVVQLRAKFGEDADADDVMVRHFPITQFPD